MNCKKCDNARKRKPTGTKIRLAQAAEEAAAHYSGEPVRLRPGPRMKGEKAGDRIDVARCPHCIKHHDRGHVCGNCGAAPASAHRLPDDGVLDEIAIERAMRGDLVRLTKTERIEAIRQLAERGVSDAQIATRLHINPKNVERLRAEHRIESRWTA